LTPIILEFQWIGSYLQKTVLNFADINENVFLISGKTGSGKTTILDAMVYALYGESSGGERDVPVSRFLSDKKEIPYVSFTFDIGGARYRFTRRYIKSAAGYTPQGEALKLVRTDSGEIWEPYINSTRSKDLTAAAEKLIGLTAEQFRQVVILPQGKCERLLTAKSKDKEAVLSTLFSADIYNAITDNLSSQAADMRRRTEDIKKSCETMLAAFDFGSADDAKAALDKSRESYTILEKKLAESKAAKENADKRRSDGVLAAKRFEALDLAESNLKSLENRLDAHKTAGERIKRLETELSVLSDYNQCVRADNEYNRRKFVADAADASLKKAAFRVDKITERLEVHKTAEQDNEKLAAETVRLEGLREAYICAVDSEKAVKALSEKGQGVRKKHDNAKKQYDDIAEKIAQLSQKKSKTEKAAAEVAQLAEKYYFLNGERKNYREQLRLETDISRKKAKTDKLAEDIGMMKAKEQALSEENTALHSRFTAEISAQLAASLHKGDCCPVCGSLITEECSHFTENEGLINESEIERSDKQLSDLRRDISALTAEYDAAMGILDELGRQAESIKTSLAISGYSENLFTETEKAYRGAMEKSDLLKSLKDEISEATLQAEKAEKSLREYHEELTALREDYIAANGELSALKKRLDPNIPNISALEERIRDYSAQVKGYRDEDKALSQENMTAVSEYSRAKSDYDNAKAEEKKSSEDFDAIKAPLNIRLSENGLPEYGEFAPDKDGIASLERLKAEYGDFENRLSSAHDAYKTISEELKDADRPNMEALEKQYTEADSLCTETEKALTLISSQIEKLKSLIERYTALSEKYSEQSAVCERREEFAKLMKGAKDVSFTRYVLGIFLDMVTDEANRMLAEKMGGRFRISRCGEETAQRGVKTSSGSKGLDFAAESFLSDDKSAMFDVRQLSGGEKFQISLVLAVALSRTMQMHFGAASIDSMFIDEGFGSLDSDALNEAVEVVNDICGSRLVGIISHVEELKNHINCVIHIEKTAHGSSIE